MAGDCGSGDRRQALCIAFVVALTFVGTAGAAAAPNRGDAVTTPGSGTLTKCRDWLVYESCSTYHRVALPGRIAVGDRIDITFGSNPKQFTFRVAAIRQHHDGCTLLSDAALAGERGDRIDVRPCRAATAPAAKR